MRKGSFDVTFKTFSVSEFLYERRKTNVWLADLPFFRRIYRHDQRRIEFLVVKEW